MLEVIQAFGVALTILLLGVMVIHAGNWADGLYVRMFKSVH